MQSSIFVRTCLLNEDSKLSISNKSDLSIKRPQSHHRANGGVDSTLEKIGAFNLMAVLDQPKSRGSVRLRSSHCESRILHRSQDIVVLREGLRFALKLGHRITLEGCPP